MFFLKKEPKTFCRASRQDFAQIVSRAKHNDFLGILIGASKIYDLLPQIIAIADIKCLYAV